jgi:transcriptional antiterminator NusG
MDGRGGAIVKQWYIVHTYSGHEQKAMRSLLDRAKTMGMEDQFDEVLIPEETVVEMVKGEKRTSKRKYFPGYILVRMELNDETWHVVRGTPKITGFVGGDKTPPPISEEEVARMTEQIKEGAAKPKPKILFDEGENVRVIDGPFANDREGEAARHGARVRSRHAGGARLHERREGLKGSSEWPRKSRQS